MGTSGCKACGSPEELSLHINVRELRAVRLAFQVCLPHIVNKNVLVLMDNMAAMFYLNMQGGARSSPLCQEDICLWEFCIRHLIHLKSSDLLGPQNELADHLSRFFSSLHEWSLHSDVVRIVFQKWGTP